MLLPAREDFGDGAGSWVHVSDLPLPRATTGWVAVANIGLPQRDLNFREHQLTLSDTAYDKGLGTYPFSEIEVVLNGDYQVFRADLGVDDEAGDGYGSVVFHVFVDEVEVFRSRTLRCGDVPVPLDLSVAGASSMRRGVADAGDGPLGDYADWADAKLFVPDEWASDEEISANLDLLERLKGEQQVARNLEHTQIAAWSTSASEMVERTVGRPGLSGGAERVAFGRDVQTGALVFANRFIAVICGFGEQAHGYLSVLDLRTGQLVLREAVPKLEIDGRAIDLHADTRPRDAASYSLDDAEDIGLGPGKSLTIQLAARPGEQISLIFALYEDAAAFTYRFVLSGVLASAKNVNYLFFDPAGLPSLSLGPGTMSYITDQSRPRLGRIADDSLRRQELVGYGKPVFIWDEMEPRGLVLALIDETTGRARTSLALGKGHVMANFGFSAQDGATAPGTAGVRRSPRLFVELANTSDTRYALASFKTVSDTLYPPLPWPSWVRYQWLSWYVYYMDINESVLRSQIDFIAENLADLGPWHIIVDAGWYVAEGRPDADWRNVDAEKFPSGLPDLVKYAHDRGVKVVLYFSAPYLNDRAAPMNWLGLRGIIDRHPEWLVPLSQQDDMRSYVYDFENPALRQYLKTVMEDYFVRYGVDGIKIDGLGNAEGELMSVVEQDIFGEANMLDLPTLPIYQFVHDTATALKDDVYFESGWSTPQFAQAFAHTFRYGDEQSSFDFPYPFCGLRQHVDYAILQETLLGQRSNMGAIRGHPDGDYLGLWWLGAALALGTQVSLSFDFTTLSPESLSLYRALLRDYEPFTGETSFGSTGFTDTFATTKNGLTFLGVLNRESVVRDYALSLQDFGLSPRTTYLVFDVYANTYYTAQSAIEALLGPEDFRLYVLKEKPGLVWSNSSVAELPAVGQSAISLEVSGPSSVEGFVDVYAPGAWSVQVDSVDRLRATLDPPSEDEYSYDSASGVVTVRYAHDVPHTILIRY